MTHLKHTLSYSQQMRAYAFYDERIAHLSRPRREEIIARVARLLGPAYGMELEVYDAERQIEAAYEAYLERRAEDRGSRY